MGSTKLQSMVPERNHQVTFESRAALADRRHQWSEKRFCSFESLLKIADYAPNAEKT
jgi:hypothetical protein